MPVVENEVWRSVGRDQTPESTDIQIENTWRSARGHHWEFPMGSVRGWIWGLSAKGLRQRVGLGGSVPGHLLHGTGTQVKLVQVIKAVRCPGHLWRWARLCPRARLPGSRMDGGPRKPGLVKPAVGRY